MMHNVDLKYSFFGLENEHIMVPNTEKKVDVPIQGQGYFVFFGDKDKIVETETVQLILDSDFPKELRDDILPNAEKFVTFYNNELGEVLDDKLIIQISYTDMPRDGSEKFELGGGAQNGQFSGIATGPIDSTNIEKEARGIKSFIAQIIIFVLSLL